MLAICKATDQRKYGLESILKDFTTVLRELHNGTIIHGVLIYGMLLYVTADTLAAQYLAGFKEGVGNANRPCRFCNVRKDKLASCVLSSDTEPRDEIEHRDRVTWLAELSKPARLYWSKEYGINGDSCLMTLPGFAITKCVLIDPMHVLLEGVFRQELPAMLRTFIVTRKYFTLDCLNRKIAQFEYDDSELNDKPQLLEAKHLERGSPMSQSAASMKVLATNLPFMIADDIPEDDMNWQCFLMLLQILLLSFSPVASIDTANTLRCIIALHHKSYVSLYGRDAVTPKMHYMLHLPEQLLRFGPLRHHSCMRFEAKHGFFKMKKWFNFKNLPCSLSFHHQRWMCLEMLGTGTSRSNCYLYIGDQVQQSCSMLFSSLEHAVLLSECLNFNGVAYDQNASVLYSSKINIRGITYRSGTVLVVSLLEPSFVVVDYIVVLNHLKLFCCHYLKIVGFDNHRNCFDAEHTKNNHVICSQNCQYPWPQMSYTKGKSMQVMLCNVEDAWML